MADGSIVFSTTLDNSDLEKQLKKAEGDIDRLQKKVESDTDKRTLIEKAMDRNEEAIHRTEQELDQLKKQLEATSKEIPQSSSDWAIQAEEISDINARIEETSKTLASQIAQQDQLNEKWQQANDVVEVSQSRLDAANAKYKELGVTAQASAAKSSTAFGRASDSLRMRISAAASSAQAALTNAANRAAAPFEMLSTKIYKTMRKVFVFSLIVAGIRAIKSELSNMINQNAQFHASIENLKAVANGFVMQLANMVLPAFIAVVNVLAGLLERIAGLIDYIFGTNIVGMIQQARANASSQIQQSNAQQSAEYSSKVAKAQNKQAKSADKLAKAQKKANAQLLAFDELNVMNAEDAEEAADAVDDYADMMEPIEQPELQTDWTQIPLPDMGLLNGFLAWLDELRNRIATDVEGPFARIREGLELIKQGIAEVIQGVSTGDWALVWQGLGDIVIGTLYVIEGALDAFLNWLDEVTGGRFTGIIQGIEQIIHGLVEVIEGLLRGDLPTFVQGLYDIVDGVVNTVNSLVETIINGVLDLISRFFDYSLSLWDELFNKLEERFPGFKDALEGLKLFIMGGLGVIQGAIEGALIFIRDLVSGVMDSLGQIVKGAIDFIVGLFTMDGSMIEQGIKGMLNGVISLLETAINSFLDGALWMLNDIIDAVNWATGQNYGYASINWITLPRLAQGAVIPPNREFMAVLGDQTSGNNIEAPEALLRQIVSEETGNAQLVTLLTQILQAVQNGHTLQCDGVTLAKVVNDRNAAGYKLYGW